MPQTWRATCVAAHGVISRHVRERTGIAGVVLRRSSWAVPATSRAGVLCGSMRVVNKLPGEVRRRGAGAHLSSRAARTTLRIAPPKSLGIFEAKYQIEPSILPAARACCELSRGPSSSLREIWTKMKRADTILRKNTLAARRCRARSSPLDLARCPGSVHGRHLRLPQDPALAHSDCLGPECAMVGRAPVNFRLLVEL